MTELKIEGMSCSHCEKSVQQALESVEGTKSVVVDLAAGRAKVEGSADAAHLIAAVEAEGYRATPAA